MKIGWLIVAGAGFLLAGCSVVAARQPRISPAESSVFHAVNGLPDFLYPLLWLPMQCGNLVVGTAAGLVVGIIDRDLAVIVGVILVMALKLVVERVVRKEMNEYLLVRQRPGTSEVGAILRGGDVPASGPSFPSGHVILAAGIACIVTPNIASPWSWVPFTLALLVLVGRMYVGAHNPLDVTAGLGTGLLLGGVIAAFVN